MGGMVMRIRKKCISSNVRKEMNKKEEGLVVKEVKMVG